VLEFVTPHRRVCGAILLVLVAAVVPNLHYFVAIASSDGMAQASVWIAFAVYAGLAWLPAVRRVSERTSFVVLLCVGLVLALCYGFDASLKQALARAAGMFDDAAPWDGVPFSDDSQEFVHPIAGYRLRVPQTWQLSEGPMSGASQFALRLDGELAAIMRPSCDLTKAALGVSVRQLEMQWPGLRRSCSRWRSLEACLLKHAASDANHEWWNWIGRRPGAMRSVRLEFLVYDSRAARDIYAVIGSVQPAPGDGPALACPVPLEWATPF
jgi:hypothetical protein